MGPRNELNQFVKVSELLFHMQEMNPASKRFQRILSNPMAYVPFKATEPWLVEYISLDLQAELHKAGFLDICFEPSTPGHFTLVAKKPQD